MQVCWAETLFAIPPAFFLTEATERPVTPWNTSHEALDGINETPGAGLNQETNTDFGAICLAEAAITQPFDHFPIAGALAESSLAGLCSGLSTRGLHVGQGGSGPASAGTTGFLF